MPTNYEGLRSFRYKVLMIQVDSIQIEVVSSHHQSRFDTSRKSIRFNSIFRPVAGGKAGGARVLPQIFRFELYSATKVEFCLLKWKAVHGSYSFQVLSITVRLCTVVLLCHWNCVKDRNRIFALPKTNKSFNIYIESLTMSSQEPPKKEIQKR